jgi:hypothetical protein
VCFENSIDWLPHAYVRKAMVVLAGNS